MSDALATPCPCCGGRMIIIDTFEVGCQPKHRPTTCAGHHRHRQLVTVLSSNRRSADHRCRSLLGTCDDARLLRHLRPPKPAPITSTTERHHHTRDDSLVTPATSIAPLADLRPHPARRWRPTNPHSASGNVSAHLSRVHSLQAFGHRPRSPWQPSSWAGIRNPSHSRAKLARGCTAATA